MAKAMDLEEGKILLFDNRDDKRNDRAPDFSGQVNVDGTLYKVALWETRDGDLGGTVQDLDDDGGGRGRGGRSNNSRDRDRESSRRDRDDDDRGRSRGRDRDDEEDDSRDRNRSGSRYRKPSRR